MSQVTRKDNLHVLITYIVLFIMEQYRFNFLHFGFWKQN